MAKIMILHHAGSLGGGSISFLDVISMLKSTENEVVGYCSNISKELYELANKRDILLENLEFPLPIFSNYNGGHSIFTRTFWWGILNLKYMDKLENLLETEKPDIVILNSSVLALNIKILKKYNVKSICYIRETLNENIFNLKTKFSKYLLSKFDGIIYLSNYDKSFFELQNKSIVIADCLNLETIKLKEDDNQIKFEEDKFNLLYVGGISWLKGIDCILQSIGEEKSDDIKLIITGNINLETKSSSFGEKIKSIFKIKEILFEKKIKRLLSREEINKKVKILGIQTNMEEIYLSVDAVVFPSNLPHQSRPLFEAGAYKLPVIIADYKQTNEYVQHNENGLLFRPKDYNDLIRKIRELKVDRAKRIFLGEENYKMTIDKHNMLYEKEKLKLFIEGFRRG